jgi:hypothetical protein
MAAEVALAMMQQEGRWLMQLCDEIPTLFAPNAGECWGASQSRRDARAGLAAPPAHGPWVLGCTLDFAGTLRLLGCKAMGLVSPEGLLAGSI